MLLHTLLALQATATPGASPPPDLRHAGGRLPSAVVAAFATRAPELDGRLDDAVWGAATPNSGFTQIVPEDGAQPSERTEIRLLFTRDALYVGARLYDTEPGAIIGRLGRRDAYTSSDRFQVNLDSYHDHRTTYEFSVNPAGVKGDGVSTNDDGYADDSWDPVWDVATTVDDEGWTVEMRIPFSQLRFSAQADPIWGVNFQRTIFRKNETVIWSWAPRTETGWASQFGHLAGLRDIPAPRRLEALPYTVTRGSFVEGANPDDPFNDGSTLGTTVGLDLKYGITSNLTLDATVNPDFGQVEADPAVVNLTAFETFFSERRPFFVEGANLFQFGAGSGGFVFGAPQLFYSRRIGRTPALFASEPGGYSDNPDASTILGAGKMSGRVGNWSVGVLEAVTQREYATLQAADGTRRSEEVEPFTNFTVASLRRDFRGGGSGIGIMMTSVARDLGNPTLQFLRRNAQAGGVDFFHRFGQNRWAVNGSLSTSRIGGGTDAITTAQRSSARYYQRPDQDYVAVDTLATSLTGWAGSMTAGKVSGNWTFGTDLYAYSPGFEVNDAGFQQQTDRIFHGVRLGHRWLQPGAVFRQFSVNGTWAQQWNFGGTRLGSTAYAGASGQFRNYWYLSLSGNYSLGGQSDKLTRGGPLMVSPGQWSGNLFVATDSRKPVSFNNYSYYARNEFGGWGGGFGGGVDLRPSGAMTLSVSPSYDRSHSLAGYVRQQIDATAAGTFGRRYVFADLDQSSVNLTLRMDMALTTDLSIQLYAQPFLAAGDYENFKELAEPNTFDFTRYGQDAGSTLSFDPATGVYAADPDGSGPGAALAFANPDFRFRSLRGNLVVRWEYLPGSTIFVVWNHGRSGFSDDPQFRLLDEFRALGGDDQTNTVLVKVNYWVSL